MTSHDALLIILTALIIGAPQLVYHLYDQNRRIKKLEEHKDAINKNIVTIREDMLQHKADLDLLAENTTKTVEAILKKLTPGEVE